MWEQLRNQTNATTDQRYGWLTANDGPVLMAERQLLQKEKNENQ